MQHHALVQLADAFAARAAEGERQKGVRQTGQPTEQHAEAEANGHACVLQVGFTHRLRMLSEKTPYTHGVRVGETP